MLAPVARADEFTLEDGPWTDLCLNGSPSNKAQIWWWRDYTPHLTPPYVEAWARVQCTVLDWLPKTAVAYVSMAKNKRIVWIDHNRPARWRVQSEAYGTFSYDWFYMASNPMYPQEGGIVPTGGLWADLKAGLDGSAYAGPQSAEWGVANDVFGGGDGPGCDTDQGHGNPQWGTIRAEKEGTENGCVRVFIKAWGKVKLNGPYGYAKVDEDPARTTLSSFTASLQTLQ